MIKPRSALPALGVGVLALTLALGPAAVAQPASQPGWRVAFSHHYGGPKTPAGFFAVSSDGPAAAWAVGGANTLEAGWPVAAHWTGRKWFATPLPHGLTSLLIAVSVDSRRDAWAVSYLGDYVLHWTGSRWFVAKRFAGGGELTGVTAFSPTDVWVFGGSGAQGGVGTWHRHGTTWTQVHGFGGNIAEASALSPTDMWAIGGINVGDDSIMHYVGGHWRHVVARPLAGKQFQHIVALPGGQVWVSQSGPRADESGVLHLSHGRWRAYAVPWRVNLGQIAFDGRGGVWVTAVTDSGVGYALHLTAAGRWFKIKDGSSDSGFGGLNWIEGTTTLWGAGGSGLNAAVWAHGPLP